MQQSDQLLINSLKDFIQIPANIQTLSDIKADEIFLISLTILQSMGIDVRDVREIEKQKFRSMTKLNQKINKQLEIQLELNALLNPTTTFIRKVLLSFLSKLGSNQNQNNNLTKQGQQNAEKRKRKKILSQWIDDEWIHPTLISQNRPNYNGYLFPLSINRKNIKSNLLPQLLKPTIKNNILPILVTSMNKNIIKQKQSQQNTGIAKKKQDQTHIDTNKLIYSNFSDWNMAEQKLNKIKRKLDKDKQQLQNTKKEQQLAKIQQKIERQQITNTPSVFQIQVQNKIQQKQKQKQHTKQNSIISPSTQTSFLSSQTDNPLQIIKKDAQNKKQQYQKLIQQLIQQLNVKRQQIQHIEKKKIKLQTQLVQDEERLIQYKTKTEQLKKQVQKKQLVLTAVQSPKQIQQQIQKYEQDIITIQQQVKKQVQTTTQNIQVIKVQSQKKLQALRDLKMKLHRIQVQYKQVCQEIQQKLQIKDKIKINKSGISRTYYSKKISQIDKRWRETQKEVQKIKKDLDQMKQKTKIVTDISDNLERQIINLMDVDKSSKNQVQNKALKQIFSKCQNCFKTTLSTLNKINQIKEQTREYQVKLHTLTSQNYRQGIQKVNTALAELKKEIQQLSKKKNSK